MATKLGKEKIEKLNKELKLYIKNTDIPIIAEFAYIHHIRRQLLYENEILSDTIKNLIDKKEFQLERKALENDIDKTMAIFSLKQLGWRDKQEIEHSGNMEINIGKEFEGF